MKPFDSLLIITFFLLSACGGYKTEGDKVYYISYNEAQGKVTRNIGADPNTFRILEVDDYGIDSAHVFFQGSLIDSADPGSFTPLSDFIGRDKKHGYYGRQLIPHSDGQTFEVIEGNFTRDRNDVYYITKPLHSSSPATFEILSVGHGHWARDGQSYFYQSEKLPIRDYETFEILDEDCFFAKDKFQVYKAEKVLEGVDAETFVFVQRCVGKDKFGCHNGRERCECPKEGS